MIRKILRCIASVGLVSNLSDLSDGAGQVWVTGSRPTDAVMRAYVLILVNVFGNGLVMAYQLSSGSALASAINIGSPRRRCSLWS
jgi:hypothetical protein